jgi:hypothetical protein
MSTKDICPGDRSLGDKSPRAFGRAFLRVAPTVLGFRLDALEPMLARCRSGGWVSSNKSSCT